MTLFGIDARFDPSVLKELDDDDLVILKQYMDGEPPHEYSESDYEYVMEEIATRFEERIGI